MPVPKVSELVWRQDDGDGGDPVPTQDEIAWCEVSKDQNIQILRSEYGVYDLWVGEGYVAQGIDDITLQCLLHHYCE
jgi:hypothetical protein